MLSYQELALNGLTYVDVPCNCGEWHTCQLPMTPDEKRAANRERVANGRNLTAYELYAVAEDAWARRTLNLDALMAQGRI